MNNSSQENVCLFRSSQDSCIVYDTHILHNLLFFVDEESEFLYSEQNRKKSATCLSIFIFTNNIRTVTSKMPLALVVRENKKLVLEEIPVSNSIFVEII